MNAYDFLVDFGGLDYRMKRVQSWLADLLAC
jgi:hypothetical protein